VSGPSGFGFAAPPCPKHEGELEGIPREKKTPSFLSLTGGRFPWQGKSSPLELLSREILSAILAVVEKFARRQVEKTAQGRRGKLLNTLLLSLTT